MRNLQVCDQLLPLDVECLFRFVETFVYLNDVLRNLTQFIVGEGRLHRHFDRFIAVGTHSEFAELADGSAQLVGKLIEDDHQQQSDDNGEPYVMRVRFQVIDQADTLGQSRADDVVLI